MQRLGSELDLVIDYVSEKSFPLTQSKFYAELCFLVGVCWRQQSKLSISFQLKTFFLPMVDDSITNFWISCFALMLIASHQTTFRFAFGWSWQKRRINLKVILNPVKWDELLSSCSFAYLLATLCYFLQFRFCKVQKLKSITIYWTT